MPATKTTEQPSPRLIKRPLYRCGDTPARSGLFQLGRTIYSVLPLGSDARDGFRVVNLASGLVYDIDTTSGQPVCDCADCTYRQRLCKHGKALLELRKKGVV